MCESRYLRVLRVTGAGTVLAETLGGRHQSLSLLAFEGDPPSDGEWVVAHSGYALCRADPEEAAGAAAELRSVGLAGTAGAGGPPGEESTESATEEAR